VKRIVFVLAGFSFPPREGLHAQSAEMMRALRARGWDVSCFARTQRDASVDIPAFLDWVGGLSNFKFYRSKLNYPLQLLVSIASNWLGVRSIMVRDIRAALNVGDGVVCHVEGIPLFPLVNMMGARVLVLSEVDAWSLRQTRLSKMRRLGLRFFLLTYAALSRFVERSILPRASFCHVVSPGDMKYLADLVPAANLTCIPVALPAMELRRPHGVLIPGELNLVFWGDIGVGHIRAGLMWLLLDVLPLLAAKGLSVKLKVLGRQLPDDELRKCGGAAEFVTWVDDVPAVLSSANAVVLPDKNGTGLKNRTLQAMACGVPVVGSEFAFEGVPVTSGVHAFVCSESFAFAEALFVISNPTFDSEGMGAAGRAFVEARYSLGAVADQWESAYSVALNRPAN